MRKTSPRTKKMEPPTAPKVLSRYLRGPTASCHDHCKCETKQTTETKPINSFPKRIPKAPPLDRTKVESAQPVASKIKKTPSVVPKATTRNVKNNKDIKHLNKKVDVSNEPKSRDLKLKLENSQGKTSSRTPGRRHSDVFQPIEETLTVPSSRISNRRLSISEIVVSVSKVSLVRGPIITKNESRKDSKLPLVNKRSNSLKPSVSAPKRSVKMPSLRSFKSLQKPELKVSRKLKPSKPVEEVVIEEKSLNVIDNDNSVETTKIESHISPDSCSSSEEKVITDVKNDQMNEHSQLMDDNTPATDSQNNGNVADSEVEEVAIEEKSLNVIDPDNSVETTKIQSPISPDSCSNSEEKVITDVHNDHVNEDSQSVDDYTPATDSQNNGNVADSEVEELVKEVGNLVMEIRDDCALENLKFKRGTILSPRSENSSPTKLQFRKGKELDENQTLKLETMSLRRMSSDGVVRIPESHTISVDLKHQETVEKKDSGLFNNVIEETASKLIQARKTKVQALVGAFENIVL